MRHNNKLTWLQSTGNFISEHLSFKHIPGKDVPGPPTGYRLRGSISKTFFCKIQYPSQKTNVLDQDEDSPHVITIVNHEIDIDRNPEVAHQFICLISVIIGSSISDNRPVPQYLDQPSGKARFEMTKSRSRTPTFM